MFYFVAVTFGGRNKQVIYGLYILTNSTPSIFRISNEFLSNINKWIFRQRAALTSIIFQAI